MQHSRIIFQYTAIKQIKTENYTCIVSRSAPFVQMSIRACLFRGVAVWRKSVPLVAVQTASSKVTSFGRCGL
jgi:hypothetical protein